MTRYNDILNGIKQGLNSDPLKAKLAKAECGPDDSRMECEKEKLEDKIELEMLKKQLKEQGGGCGCAPATTDPSNVYPENEYQEDRLSLLSEEEEEGPKEEMDEYKRDFYEMSVGSIKSIMTHAYNILKALDNPSVKNNLTETWLQGKIAVTEDYMITIHNFVMFGRTETDTQGSEQQDEKKN